MSSGRDDDVVAHPGALGADEREALIAAYHARLDALRDSAQYRIGDLVMRAARSPRRAVRLPVDLWRLRKELLSKHRVEPPRTEDAAPVRDVSVLTVLDEFSHRAFGPEWAQHPLAAGTAAADQLADSGAQVVFVESAWEGNGGAFRYELSHFATRERSPIRELLGAAKAAGVPTVFWNKEDPVHFERFAPAAREFDWILTSDADCLGRYRRLAGHDRVAALPFAAQPRIHNPLDAGEPRLARACFAGSWRADDYAGRGADVAMLLRPVLDAGLLDIFDRMASPGATGVRFPAPYDQAVRGHRPYDELLADYRRYACFLNVNSVTTSPTMCSRRVFELLACRTPVVSTPSRAIEALLGDTVITVETEADTRAAVERLTSDVEHRERVGHRGYRAVMSRHTYGHRVDELLERLGLATRPVPPSVAVLAATRRPEFLERLLANFTAQRDVDAELIVLTNSARFYRGGVDAAVAKLPKAKAIHLSESLTLGECLNAGLDATDARYVAKFDDDDHYGAHHLHDSLLAFGYTGAAIVGKKTSYAHLEASDETVLRFPGNEYTYANRVAGGTMVIDRERFRDVRFAPLNTGTDSDLCERALAAGLAIFSTDRFNYVQVRRSDTASHSWAIGDDVFASDSIRVAPGLPLDRTMI